MSTVPPNAGRGASREPSRQHYLEVAELRTRLERHRPHRAGAHDGRGAWQAATALVVAPDPAGSAIAFIRRTERPGDRWSGQMALPGGTRDPEDPDLSATAVRETQEEVGLALGAPLTRLPDQGGRISRGVVATFVHVLEERPPLTAADPREVAEALWIPLPDLVDPAARSRARWNGVPVPGIDHGGRVIWGLTLRILHTFFDAVSLSRL